MHTGNRSTVGSGRNTVTRGNAGSLMYYNAFDGDIDSVWMTSSGVTSFNFSIQFAQRIQVCAAYTSMINTYRHIQYTICTDMFTIYHSKLL